MIVDYIDAHRARFGVDPICRVLSEHGVQIAPSTYYAHKKTSPVTEAVLAEAYDAHAVFEVFDRNRRVYGVRKLWHALTHAGHAVGRDQVARLMRVYGISGTVRGVHRTVTTSRDERAARFPDHVQRHRHRHRPTAPDQLWVADFTYVWTLAGFVYVAFLVDVYSRRILGRRVMSSKHTPLVTSFVEQALFTRRLGEFDLTTTDLVHHSDAGSQDTSMASSKELREAGTTGSIGSVDYALDNALMESTIGLYKTELIDVDRRRSWSGSAEVECETAAWVHWHNTERLHSAIGYTAPAEFENRYRHNATPTPEVA